MRKSIFVFTLTSAALLSAAATAQLDLEDLMQDEAAPAATEDATSQIAAPENNLINENDSADDDAVILPEDEPDEADTSAEISDSMPENSEDNVPNDDDDFMVQYFNDVDAAAAEDAKDEAARNSATELIHNGPTMVTLPEEQQKLLKISEKRWQQREQERQRQIEEKKRIEAEILAQKEAEEKAKAEAEAAAAEAEASKDPKVIAARKAQAEQEAREKMLRGHEKAPFGLYWGLSKEQTETLGFKFKPAELENAQNAYALTNPKQQQNLFEPVFVVFGNKDCLQTVYAEGIFTKDTPQAERVLQTYNRYYAALKHKYGNDKEYFIPNVHEETLKAPAAIKQTAKTAEAAKIPSKTVVVEHPRGNDNFLKELQDKKAMLYAVFGNKNIKITLSTEVNSEGQSRIVLDYENLKMQEVDENETLNDLMNEL